MKLTKPYKECQPSHLTQGFHENHKANDWGFKYGTFIVAPFNAKVLTIRKPDNVSELPEYLRGGCGIRIQNIEDPTVSMTIWHCNNFFPVQEGDTVLQGQPIAIMANSGFVMANGKYVEIDIRTIPPYPGTHAHISMGQEKGGVYTDLDYSKFIDWSIPISYNWFDTTKIILKKALAFLQN